MEETHLQNSSIILVDDEPANVRLLEKILGRAGYGDVRSTTDPRTVVPQINQRRPDLLIMDLHMPHINGFEILEQINKVVPERSFFPVLVLTADRTEPTEERALKAGARDFLTKPFRISEALLRIRNLLEIRSFHRLLEERVEHTTRAYEHSQFEILERLAQAAEFRDDDTGEHTRRVGEASSRLAGRLDLHPVDVELIRRAAPLHDVGKISIPDAILLKPGRLTAEEFEVMKSHASSGAKLLAGGKSELIRMAEEIALCHHERWDGRGYPGGLAGEEIPMAARIVAVVDVYDALSSDRPYRAAWPREVVLEEIRKGSGTHFDSSIVEAFLDMQKSGQEAATEKIVKLSPKESQGHRSHTRTSTAE